MNCAVKVSGMNAIFFLLEPPDDQEGIEIEPGAWVEVPMNVNLWPEGSRQPETLLCLSSEDPKHYKLFKYRNEIDGTEWQEAGLDFGGTFSKASWERFADKLPAIRALQAVPDDEEI